MNTPICDFVQRYEACKPIRLHMPGHKQGMDITEIPGADVLYAADGIIRESEENATDYQKLMAIAAEKEEQEAALLELYERWEELSL